MKVLIDTNVLVSTVLNPNGAAASAYTKATSPPFECVICDYVIDEFVRIATDKLKLPKQRIDAFVTATKFAAKIIKTPHKYSITSKVSDPKDLPILKAAVKEKADLLLTGDKPFLATDIKAPRLISPREFLDTAY